MKHKLMTLFTIAFAFSGIFMNVNNAFAVEDVEILDTGRCGENVYWTMYSDGTLDLSGTGATYDYTEGHQDETDWCDEWGCPKWYDEYQSFDIKNIIINEGITRIGDLTFSGSYGELETINLPDSLEEIGYFALSPMGYVGDVTSHKINRLPENLKVIEDGGLFGIDFEEKVVLPENIEKIGSLALNTFSKEYVLPENIKEISPLALGVTENEEYVDNDPIYDDFIEDYLDKWDKFLEIAILKKNCDAVLDMFVPDSEVNVYGYKNTVSETYALENGFTFIALDEEPITTTSTDYISTETTATTTSIETDITDTSETTTASTETDVTYTSETTTTLTETDVTDTSETTTASTETDATDTSETTTISTETDVTYTSETTTTSTETDVTDTSETTTTSTDEQLPQAGMPWTRTVEGLAVMFIAGGTMLIVKSRRNER